MRDGQLHESMKLAMHMTDFSFAGSGQEADRLTVLLQDVISALQI